MAAIAPGITPYRFGFNNPIAYTDPMGLFDWYANADGGIEYREDIKSQADLDRKGIKGEYKGTQGYGVNEAGDWISFNADGSTSLTGTPMLDAVTVTGTQSKSEKNMAAAYQLGIYSGHSAFFRGVAGAGHGGLDLIGMIPALGEGADLVNAGLYTLEGDYSNALIGLGAAVPFLGYAATAYKYTKRSRIVVNSASGADVRSFKIIREIQKGEKIEDLVTEAKQLTRWDDVEHAAVKLTDGRRALVSGGKHGISFPKGTDDISHIYGHTHPALDRTPFNAPSPGDRDALQRLNQSKQYIYHDGQRTTIYKGKDSSYDVTTTNY